MPIESTSLILCRTTSRHGERRQFELLSRCAGDRPAVRRSAGRRGPAFQQNRRALEGQVRVRAVAIGRWAHGRGLLWIEVAASIGLSPRTLCDWRGRWRTDRLRGTPRGRPCVRSARDERNAVIRFIDPRGPCVGLPALRAAFPTMRRSELADRLAHYRTLCRRLSRRSICRLTWLRVGAVWGMDFVQAPELVDGRYPFLWSVEDLASRSTLLWCPVNHSGWKSVAASVRYKPTTNASSGSQ